MIDYTLNQFVLRLVAMVVVAAVHGFAVAGTAVALGDPDRFYEKHCRATTRPSGATQGGKRLPDVVPSFEDVERIRRIICYGFALANRIWEKELANAESSA